MKWIVFLYSHMLYTHFNFEQLFQVRKRKTGKQIREEAQAGMRRIHEFETHQRIKRIKEKLR